MKRWFICWGRCLSWSPVYNNINLEKCSLMKWAKQINHWKLNSGSVAQMWTIPGEHKHHLWKKSKRIQCVFFRDSIQLENRCSTLMLHHNSTTLIAVFTHWKAHELAASENYICHFVASQHDRSHTPPFFPLPRFPLPSLSFAVEQIQ